MKIINILGVKIAALNMKEAFDKAVEFLSSEGANTIFTPNSEIVMNAYKNKDFLNIINSADMCTPDGIGLIYASKILKTPLSQRVAGFDLTMKLLEELPKLSKSVYFFGSAPGIAQEAKNKITEKIPGLNVCGISDGYFDDEKEKEIISDINQKKPDLLLVCLGSPKQERWIHTHKDELNVKLIMGVGGTLDVISGNVKRAPDIFIKLGLEWFYRLIKQPSRIGRMMALPQFLFTVILKRGEKHYD